MNKAIYHSMDVPSDLEPYVSRLLLADCPTPVSFSSPAAPTGGSFLGWVFRGSMSGSINGKLEFSTAGHYLHLSGQLKDETVNLEYRGAVGHALVQFKAAGLYQLTGVPGEVAYGRNNDLREFGVEMAQMSERLLAISNCLDPASSAEKYLECLVEALRERLRFALPIPTFLEKSLTIINASNGAARISDVASSVSVSQRHLARAFNRIVGLQPKMYCRILQLNRALETLLHSDGAELVDIAHRNHFADQAHLSRVFQEFLGSPPNKFASGDEAMLHQMMGNPNL